MRAGKSRRTHHPGNIARVIVGVGEPADERGGHVRGFGVEGRKVDIAIARVRLAKLFPVFDVQERGIKGGGGHAAFLGRGRRSHQRQHARHPGEERLRAEHGTGWLVRLACGAGKNPLEILATKLFWVKKSVFIAD